MANTVDNVSVGKPAGNGAVWRAPLGTTLPTDTDTALNEAFKCLGYCSEDGYVQTTDISTEEIKAWGGDTVDSSQNGKIETHKFTAIESMNPEVLKAAYGDSNVSVDGTSHVITVRHNSVGNPACIYVVDMLMRNGGKRRVVIPNAKMTALDDVTFKDDTPIGYGITLTALSGGFGAGDNDVSKEYIKPATT